MATRRRPPATHPRRVKSSQAVGDEATSLVEVLGARHPVAISGEPRDRIVAIAELQRGRASRWQLLAAGIADRTIYHLVANGFLRRVGRAVYAIGHRAPAPLTAETEALLACGPHAVLSHHAAARLLKLLPDTETSIHVTIRARHGANPAGVRVHRTTRLNRSEVRIVDGLPVTSPLRTLLDLAGAVDLRTLERTVEEAIIQKLTSRRQLKQALIGANGRSGMAHLRAILDQHREPSVTRSEAERRLKALIQAAHLPEPLTNVRLHGFEADFYWPDAGVVIEVQSHRFHLTPRALERDTRKAATFTAAGLTVSYVTWLQMEREPYAVVARIAQVLALATASRR